MHPELLIGFMLVVNTFPELAEEVRLNIAADVDQFSELLFLMRSPASDIPGRVLLQICAVPNSGELECHPGWEGVSHAHHFSWRHSSIEETVLQSLEYLRSLTGCG